jgi:GT2 family glycosyltransferase
MDLSVIIVSYNVKYFVEQCLHAVVKSSAGISCEIFVVDNNSADGSSQMIRERFPMVRLISNSANAGFARANNQAIKIAKGRYVLLLNPDTVVQEDTFEKCLAFMNEHPDVGCLGVKMIDGKGHFLPESKRALPTPAVAFYKIFGLSALFPRSRRFGRYHLGYLDRDSIHDVDVISGAFMLLRNSALKRTGFLDEDFFMYGEDIDLSYRMKLAGFRNVYFPGTTIIHYKGESTRKGSINYVLMFYQAMIIFARKHFSPNTFQVYSTLIHLAIYIRAGFSILQRFIFGIANPLLDALLIFGGYYFFLPVWEQYVFGTSGIYPGYYLNQVVPTYILIWLASVFLTTGYEKFVKLSSLIKGIITGSVIILVLYALLPENLRFSRALILMGTGWAIFSTIASRSLLSAISRKNFRFEIIRQVKRILIVGTIEESNRILSIIRQTRVRHELLGFVDPDEAGANTGFIGHIGQIEEIVKINRADELIFCAGTMSAKRIITTMLKFTNTEIAFKIAPPEGMSVIGSSTGSAEFDLYVLHFNTLARVLNRRKKRLFDILVCMILALLSPVLIFIVPRPWGLLQNMIRVLFGFSSWVGYHETTGGDHPELPRLKPGVLTPLDVMKDARNDVEFIEKANLNYAKDYEIKNDLNILLNAYRYLGRTPAMPLL